MPGSGFREVRGLSVLAELILGVSGEVREGGVSQLNRMERNECDDRAFSADCRSM